MLVAGAGNAALCAALAARQTGATVLVLEAAPKHMRGGNSRHTRNLRCMHDAPSGVLVDSYTENEYWDDLIKVTGGNTNERLARIAIRGSGNCREWMISHGARFQPSLEGTLHLSRTNAFFLGGGKAVVNAYCRAAEKLGVEIEYDTEITGVNIQDGNFQSVVAKRNGSSHGVRAKAFVAASGGFQANIPWLKEAWGDAAENFIIRGTPYDQGRVLRLLMDQGAKTVGDPAQCHAIALDARAPRFDGGIVTRVDSISLGIVVNRNAVRFYDEGEDFWPKRYAIWGRLIAQQPGQIAFSILDSKCIGKFMPPAFPPVTAGTINELARALALDPNILETTVSGYNAAVCPGTFNHALLDDCTTQGLTPPKSHWAMRLDSPPFYAYPLRPGITFTYLGVGVNERAQLLMQDDKAVPNIFAAGEIMAGNILGKGYLAGLGMTIGTVFGRIAGEEAARYARS
ncbi:MAG: FAD-dependent tricarballylate dehydrogenase TcuA [Acidobacteria bacterium]|nr:FAD-dependent tricarballylate dehydrogenase TcuA [Acidobacteriota bacterium]